MGRRRERDERELLEDVINVRGNGEWEGDRGCMGG
jgi:hypothetical protein